MPDDATQTTGVVPPPTTDAAPPAETAPSASQTTTQTPDPGGITDADFSHPEYGVKLKNAYTGMQKAQQESADLKKAKAALEGGVGTIRAMIQEDPAVASSMVRYLESKGQPVPPLLRELAAKGAAKQDDDNDDTRPLTKADEKRLRADMEAHFSTRDTVAEFMREAGGGDTAKGSAIYHKDGQDILKIMDEYAFPATPKHMSLAHKILTERRAASRPTQTETKPSEPSAAADMGRANGGAPTAAPIEGVPTLQQWLAQAGYSSEEAFLRDQRAGA